jgi:5-methylcytosine-specific restriction endonuclease McrA
MSVSDEVMAFIVLLTMSFLIAARLKRKTKRRSNWYLQKKWTAVRNERRRINNEKHGLGKTRDGKWLLLCERCGLVGCDHHVDHILARSRLLYRAFQYALWNTQILCAECNITKSNRWDGKHWRFWRAAGGPILVWLLRRRQDRKREVERMRKRTPRRRRKAA